MTFVRTVSYCHEVTYCVIDTHPHPHDKSAVHCSLSHHGPTSSSCNIMSQRSYSLLLRRIARAGHGRGGQPQALMGQAQKLIEQQRWQPQRPQSLLQPGELQELQVNQRRHPLLAQKVGHRQHCALASCRLEALAHQPVHCTCTCMMMCIWQCYRH